MPKALKPIEDVALGLLARREHSVAELRNKLKLRGYPIGEIEDILKSLQDSRALNDARYAEARARSRAETSKWGAMRIRQELAQTGVAKDTAAATLANLNETHDWLAVAQDLARRHFKTPLVAPLGGQGAEAYEAYRKEKARRVGFFVRRGFTLAQALAALNMVGTEEDIEGL